MKKIYLQKIMQYDAICYVGKIDPRDLVKVATKIEMGEIQDAQRPLNKRRVEDIAKYVNNRGILPNTLTLATNSNKFEIKTCDELANIYYIEFPNSKEEFNKFQNSIDVMDGQHRLYSFLDDFCSVGDDVSYEVGFTLYIQPSLDEKRKIFVSCNEKQEKVSGNLLMWFRDKLNMLSNEEKEGYSLVGKLNENLPLKGHIIMSAERIKNGVKAKEVIAAIKQAKINEMSFDGKFLKEEQKFNTIRQYLFAWEEVVGFSFQTSSAKEAGAAIKMSGLKYMLLLLPTIWELALNARIKQTEFKRFFSDTIKKLIEDCGVVRESFFTCDEHKMFFRERTAIDKFASESIRKIKTSKTDNFNPFN